jgi:Family of unknown function (DUF6088)
MRDLKSRIAARIHAGGRGQVYISKDFLDLGSRAAVDQALSRMVKDGTIRRIGRGIFDYPRTNPKLGLELAPDVDRVAQAVARGRGGQLQPSGAVAANDLGLSTQVPGKHVYSTAATSGHIRVGKQTLTLKRVSPKRLVSRDKVMGPVLRALYFIGKDGLTDDVVSRLRSTLSDKDRQKLLRESRYTVGWLSEAAQKIAKD